LRPADAIASAAELIRRMPTQANTAVYVASDFQRRDWIPADSTSRRQTPSAIGPLAELANSGRSVRLTLLDVGAEHPANLAVTAIESTSPRAVAGIRSRFEIEVTNFSDSDISDAELRVAIADQALPPIILQRLDCGASIREPVEIALPQEGSDRVVADVASSSFVDRLPLDNRR